MKTVTLISLSLALMISSSEQNQILTVNNTTRSEGGNEVTIPCLATHEPQATPFWKINDTIYYYSDVPWPLISSPDGTTITIPVVDLFMNGTSFQCFIPTSSGDGLISSSVGTLTVTENVGNIQVPTHDNSQSQLSLDHQRLLFSTDSFTLAWRVVGNETRGYYHLTTGSSCDRTSNSTVLVNHTESNNFVLHPRDLLDEGTILPHFKLTFTDHNETDISLETILLTSGIMTENLHTCQTGSTCIKIPPLRGRKTLVLAIPFLSLSNVTEQDLLCPVHPYSSESCVDLLSCSRFNKTVYANSITVCKTVDFESSLELEMCFHNVTEVMNGTKLHLFYSDLQCSSGGVRQSSRIYTSSMQLITSYKVQDIVSVMITSDINICLESNLSCFQDLKNTSLKLSIKDNSNCIAYQTYITTNSSCISLDSLTVEKECAESYHLEIETHTGMVYTQPLLEIPGHNNILAATSSKCHCHKVNHSSTNGGSQHVAVTVCVVIFFIMIVLLVAIVIVSINNIKNLRH